MQAAAARRIEAAKPQEQKTAEAWERVKEDIDRFVDWNLCSTNLYNRLETIARKGEVELMQRAIDYVRELNKGRNVRYTPSGTSFLNWLNSPRQSGATGGNGGKDG